MNIKELLAFEDYKDGLKALYEEYDLTLGYKTEEINKEEYKQDYIEYNFNLTDSPDERNKQIENNKFLRDTYGWDLTELWNLDRSIVVFLLPRLYVFYKTDDSLDQLFEEGSLGQIIETILEGFIILLNEYKGNYEEDQREFIEAKPREAFMLLGKYAQRLWN